MNFKKVSISIFILAFFINAKAQQPIIINSPDNNIKAEFWLSNSGEPVYSVMYKNKKIVLPSTLGFDYKLGIHAKDNLDMQQNFSLVKSEPFSYNGSWKPVWGEENEIKEHYNATTISLVQSKSSNKPLYLNIVFKVCHGRRPYRILDPRRL